ncbi:ATP-dependent DNA helicase [Trichonephila clavipes]|nr:ATP-dependent DNA helicase [Trichonephila clavipes]
MGDKEAQVNMRSEYVQGVERNTVQKIQQQYIVLRDHNILVHEFKMAKDRVTSDNYKVVIHPDRVPRGEYERRFNAPTTNEIAAVVVSSERTASWDIVIQAHDGRFTRVPDTHTFYDALEYPIIFWKGQEGYSFDIPQINPFTKQPIPNKKVSCKEFYACHMMVRRNNFNLLLRCRLPFHQFLVDMYVKVESERLRFIALNQTKLRAENYIHLQDAIRNDADLDSNSLGQMVILPSSFVNSARYLHEYTQDAFTYVRNYGGPDLFITMTCNPAWPEITIKLIPGQNSTDRHDLTARVFKVKVQKLVALLTKASETSVYNSIDTVMSSKDTTSYPVEFLNSLDLSGVASHKLELKAARESNPLESSQDNLNLPPPPPCSLDLLNNLSMNLDLIQIIVKKETRKIHRALAAQPPVRESERRMNQRADSRREGQKSSAEKKETKGIAAPSRVQTSIA